MHTSWFPSTLVALRGKDGIVIAVENIISSKLHEPRSTHHLHAVDVNIGVVRAAQ